MPLNWPSNCSKFQKKNCLKIMPAPPPEIMERQQKLSSCSKLCFGPGSQGTHMGRGSRDPHAWAANPTSQPAQGSSSSQASPLPWRWPSPGPAGPAPPVHTMSVNIPPGGTTSELPQSSQSSFTQRGGGASASPQKTWKRSTKWMGKGVNNNFFRPFPRPFLTQWVPQKVPKKSKSTQVGDFLSQRIL